jgi:hypothetical protein
MDFIVSPSQIGELKRKSAAGMLKGDLIFNNPAVLCG